MADSGRRDFLMAAAGALFGIGASEVLRIGADRIGELFQKTNLIITKPDVEEAISTIDELTYQRILDNAAKVYPKSKPYLGFIEEAFNDNKQKVPLEGFIAKMQQESKFYPHAVSPAFAEGISQFMELTARADMKMHVYWPFEFLDLYKLKRASADAFSHKRRMKRRLDANQAAVFANYRGTSVPASVMKGIAADEKRFVEAKQKELTAFNAYKLELSDTLHKFLPNDVNIFDERHVPRTAIRKSFEYDVRNFKELVSYFKGPRSVLMEWAFIAYNHGLSNVFENPGLPPLNHNNEPHIYMQQIAVNVVELYVGKRLRKDKLYYDNKDFWLTPNG